jgi:hypothetical protein
MAERGVQPYAVFVAFGGATGFDELRQSRFRLLTPPTEGPGQVGG